MFNDRQQTQPEALLYFIHKWYFHKLPCVFVVCCAINTSIYKDIVPCSRGADVGVFSDNHPSDFPKCKNFQMTFLAFYCLALPTFPPLSLCIPRSPLTSLDPSCLSYVRIVPSSLRSWFLVSPWWSEWGWWSWRGSVSSSLLAFEMNDIIGIRSIHLAGEMLQRESGKQKCLP